MRKTSILVSVAGVFALMFTSCGDDEVKIPHQWVTTTLAGSTQGYANGEARVAQFNSPDGLAVDADGNVYIADQSNHRIRKIEPDGTVSTIAGSGTAGYLDGADVNARFNNPTGIAVDGQGNLFVCDYFNNRIRKITPAGVVSTFAGSVAGYADETGTDALFDRPTGITIDEQGNLFITDQFNHRIRKITPEAEVTTIAGNGNADFADGNGNQAKFNTPSGIAIDSKGNLYVGDQNNNRIRKINPNGNVTTFAGAGDPDFADGKSSSAKFFSPSGVALDKNGNLYVADSGNNRIRKITPSGNVSTIAGNGDPGSVDGPTLNSTFRNPFGVAIDANDKIYVGDRNNHLVRKIEQL